jgi:spore coat protein U-like protein
VKRLLIATTALMGVLVAQNAWAGTATTTITVSAGVAAACTISATRLAFHSVITSTLSTGSASITVNCTSGAPIDIGLSYGNNASSAPRRLQGITITNFVSYVLFQDFANTILWGNNVGFDTLASTGTGANQVFQVYGQVPSQSVTADTYTDSVTVTVTF